ncbi:PEP-CTERM sorting domain-containing protein [bacterium]|nr:PEP-CTERM sorting domain-containing protein [bacterium]
MRALIIAAILIVCCGPAMCQAIGAQQYSALVMGQPVDIGDPSAWVYTLTNTSASANYTIWLLAIEVDESTDVLNVSSPSGWACDTSVPHFISWMYVTNELYAGESENGFQAEYSAAPAYQSWTVMFNNIDNPGESPSEFGVLETAVPEPASMIAMLVGITSLVGVKMRRRV